MRNIPILKKLMKTVRMMYSVIYSTTDSSEIAMIRNLLEENKIPYETPDEFTYSASGIAGLGMAGMRVLVPEEKREQAVAILKSRGFS